MKKARPVMTPDEARAWFEANRERLRERFGEIPDPPPEATPDGTLVGPQTELDFRRMLREMDEELEDED